MSTILSDVQLINNASERLPCILALDCSGSMQGEAITQLNFGLKAFEDDLKSDELASQRVQVLVVAFGGNGDVRILTPWTDASSFTAPTLSASGNTPMGTAMSLALNEIEQRKEHYRSNGISYKRPWIFLLSDGEPTDPNWEFAAGQCHQQTQEKKAEIFPIGVQGANREKLAKFSNRGCILLRGLMFRELFVWLSRSVSAGSKAAANAPIQLAAGIDQWARPVS